MGYPTKVQLIKRKASEQWYINFPAALAQAMEFKKGELVEWLIEDRSQLVLNRPEAPPSRLKKKPEGSATASKSFGGRAKRPSAKKELPKGQKG